MRNGVNSDVISFMAAQHIAIILHDFSTGGTERIAIRLANKWVETGRRVMIFCGTQEGTARLLVDPAVEIIASWPPIRRGCGSRIRFGWRLAKMLAGNRPDIVFAPGNFHFIVLAIAAWRSQTPRPTFICKISNPLLPAGAGTFVRRLLGSVLARVLAPIDQLTAMSPLLARDAQSVLANRSIAYIPEPVLDRLIAPKQPVSRSAEPLILCVGRLERQKDFQLALRAFAELSPLSRAKLTILGEGPERRVLIALARQLGIRGQVDMPGHVTNVHEWMNKARLFLMTSQFEGFPAVLIEARAAGLPIVTTDCSVALPEILTAASHGEIVHSGLPSQIAGAIRRQLENGSANSSEIVPGAEAFLIDAIAPQWLTFFDDMMEQRSNA